MTQPQYCSAIAYSQIMSLDGREKAKIYSTLSRSYNSLGKIDSATYYMAESAISDLRSSVRETTAARDLASLMLRQGDTERASAYINLALDDAKAYNSSFRMIELSNVMPLIEAARHNEMVSQRNILFVSIIVFGIMIVIVLVLLAKIHKQNTVLRKIHQVINAKNLEP